MAQSISSSNLGYILIKKLNTWETSLHLMFPRCYLNQNIFYAPASLIAYFKKWILIEMLNFNERPMLYKRNQLNIL